MVNYSYFIRRRKKLHLCVTRRSFSSIAICAKLIFSDHDKFRNAASIARSDVSLETKKEKRIIAECVWLDSIMLRLATCCFRFDSPSLFLRNHPAAPVCIHDSVVNLLSTTIYYETSLVSQLANALRALY